MLQAGYWNATPGLQPSFLNSTAAGQKPVTDACIRFTPTKAFSRYQ